MSVKYQCGRILLESAGLTRDVPFTDGSTSTVELKWTEIKRVLAFKRDLFAYDLVSVEFQTSTMAIEADEQMEGWDEMITALPGCLPGTPEPQEWWNKVVNPAFESNVTQLFPPVT
jgi:hypothetical protein